jgi:hypothetical protein
MTVVVPVWLLLVLSTVAVFSSVGFYFMYKTLSGVANVFRKFEGW